MMKAASTGLRRIGQNKIILNLKTINMKGLFFILLATATIGTAGKIDAQTSATKVVSATEVTPANVLKWTKEVLPKMERLVPKLNKIKAANPGKPTSDALKLLATVNHLKEINTKGAKLKTAEGKRYYDLIAATVNSFYIECQSGPNNNGVCCVDCQNHGILGVWCFANCFVARFPGID